MRKTRKDEIWSKIIKCSYKNDGNTYETSCIALLNVPKRTRVYTEGNHHRAKKAIVKEIFVADTKHKNTNIENAWSGYNNSVSYKVGKTIVADDFSNEEIMNTNGIHGWTCENVDFSF